MGEDVNTLKLIPISPVHEGIFRTVLFLSKMDSKREIVKEKLINEYNKNPKDLNAAFACAFHFLMPSDTVDLMERKEYVDMAMEIFDNILENEPGNWLARYNKVKLVSLFADNFRNDNEIIEDIESLISIQEKSEYKPYFILPYLLLAEIMFDNGNMEECNKYVQKATTMEKSYVGLLEDFLYHQLVGFTGKLYAAGEYGLADAVKGIANSIFLITHG